MVIAPKKSLLNVLSPLSHVIKAQCHWANDIEHFGTDKVRVLEIEQNCLYLLI